LKYCSLFFLFTFFSLTAEETLLDSSQYNLCDECCPLEIFADFIYWSATEAGADTWAEVIIEANGNSSNDILGVDFGWDPGFKAGVGYQINQGKYDVKAYYSWFHTVGKESISSIPGAVHSTFLGNFYADNPLGIGISGPSYERAHISWAINFNTFDWQIGCNYCVDNCFSLRPFMGLKGGWIDQTIQTKWINPDILGFTFTSQATERLENNYWGIGPTIGIDTKWILFNLQSYLYLFGDFAASFMWGHWTFSDEFASNFSEQISIELENLNGGASVIQTFIGLGWDHKFCSSCFTVKVGYEAQFWLDQLQFYSFTGGRLVNLLALQGGTIELSFDF